MATSRNCLFLVNNLGIGGSERKTVRVVNSLKQGGYNVHLSYLNKPDTLLDKIDAGVPVVCLNRCGKIDWDVVIRLREYISNNNIDLIWSINLYPMIYSYFSTRRSRERKIQYVSINTTYFPNVFERVSMLLYAPLLHLMDKIIFGSQHQQKRWSKNYFLNNKTVLTIHNGVDLGFFNPGNLAGARETIRKSLGISDSEILVGMVAQFRPEKAYSDLVRATKILVEKGQSVKLLLVGDGSERQHIERLVISSGLDNRVIFSGQLPDVRPQLLAMDVFVLTSTSVETFSNAALEAMAMGKPVVLSRLSGAPEMVEDGKNGYLYEPGNVSDLIKKLENMLDRSIRDTCAANALLRVREEFTFDGMVTEYERLIQENR